MKKGIAILLVILMMGIFFPCFADRSVSTIKAYTASTLIKRGDAKVYRVTFIASASNGCFGVYDSLTVGGTSVTNIKTEGSEATANNGKPYDFTGKPLEFSTGLYLYINNGIVTIEYE